MTFGEHGRSLTPHLLPMLRLAPRPPRPRPTPAEIRIQTQLRKLLEDAGPKYRRKRWHRQLANIYSNLLKVSPALWTFTTIDGW